MLASDEQTIPRHPSPTGATEPLLGAQAHSGAIGATLANDRSHHRPEEHDGPQTTAKRVRGRVRRRGRGTDRAWLVAENAAQRVAGESRSDASITVGVALIAGALAAIAFVAYELNHASFTPF